MIRRPAAPARPVRRLRPLALAALLLGASVPDPGDPPRGDLRVVVVSDLNGAYGSTAYDPEVHRAVRLIREVWRPDLVLAAGDLVAGQKPALSDAEVRAMWAAFDSTVARPLREARIPFGFTLGNHDGSAYPAHRRDRLLAEEHWRAPGRRPGVAFADGAHCPAYYSFTRGGLFVLVWDASFAGTAGERAMLEWARGQLASAPARAARHRLVLGHLPLYAVAEGRNRPGEVLDEADSLRALLERCGVDTYVSGHHHAYYPGRRGRLELLHAGAVGQGPRPLLAGGAPPAKTATVLDFHFAADSVAYTTYAFDPGAPDGLRRLETAALPPALHGFNGRVVRRDLPDGRDLDGARIFPPSRTAAPVPGARRGERGGEPPPGERCER
ncbi:MAG TPA: metallophosphoesterase [Longimicrobiaceae bacterium]|nr:metallophosphoesterase [Longimicrobiaceae bacterium]